jgi:hypothetical protein
MLLRKAWTAGREQEDEENVIPVGERIREIGWGKPS